MTTADTIVVFNAGSTTLKFALFRFVASDENGECLFRDQIDLESDSHKDAVKTALETIDCKAREDAVTAVGHRIVHGGSDYTETVCVDSDVISRLVMLLPLAPLHQAQGLSVIEAVQAGTPGRLQFGSFDTAFHATMPEVARHFALPRIWFDRGVRRYGFHGLSYEYVALRLRELCVANMVPMTRVVVAHLGSGASLCAMQDGASIATTMSFTPTDGLMMATRSGALDPSVVTYLLREHGLTVAGVERLLNHDSGLLGVSGLSGDIRDLIASDAADSKFSVDLFIHRIVVEIGAMVAALGGFDGLVFTGGIGTHQPIVRQRVCEALAWLDVDCDSTRNATAETRFDSGRGRVALWNIPTDEELIIARKTFHALRAHRLRT